MEYIHETFNLQIVIRGEMGWFGWQLINPETDCVIAEGSNRMASPVSALKAALRDYADRL